MAASALKKDHMEPGMDSGSEVMHQTHGNTINRNTKNRQDGNNDPE